MTTKRQVPTPPTTNVASRFVRFDGIRTHYLEAGEGPPVVLIHSGEFGGTAEFSWEYQFAALSEHYRVLAPEQLGFGETDKLFDFENWHGRAVWHLSRFCEVMDVPSAAFVGTSMGAKRLLEDVAADSPQLPVAAMVLIAGGGFVPQNADRHILTGFDGSPEAMAKILEILFVDAVWAEDSVYLERRAAAANRPGAWESTSASRLLSPQAQAKRQAAAEAAWVDPVDYSRVTIPTLLVAGEKDRVKEPEWGHQMLQNIPHAELVVVEGAGHLPHIEGAATFNVALLDFLDRNYAIN